MRIEPVYLIGPLKNDSERMKKDMEDRDKVTLIEPDYRNDVSVPLAASGVSAGFPSAADDFIEEALDLNKALIRHPEATFYARVSGESMKDDCVEDGDLLVVDKALRPYDGCLAVAYLDGEFTLKRVQIQNGEIWLVPANKKFKPIRVTEDNDFTVWGVCTYVIKKV